MRLRLRYLTLLWALVVAALCYGLATEPTVEIIIGTPPTATVASCHGPTCTG